MGLAMNVCLLARKRYALVPLIEIAPVGSHGTLAFPGADTSKQYHHTEASYLNFQPMLYDGVVMPLASSNLTASLQ